MATVTDPVCGMTLDSSQAAAQTIFEDAAFYFCSEECRRMFEANPEEYVGNDQALNLDDEDEPIPL